MSGGLRLDGREAVALTRLALPIIMARIGLTLMLVVDNMIVGHFGTGALAGFSLGLVLVQTMQTIGLGLLLGGMVEISAAYGRGATEECGRIWRRSLLYALVIGAGAVAVADRAEGIFLALGQDPALAAEAAWVAAVIGWSLPPMLCYIASIGLLEATGRPYVGVVLLAAANLINLGLNLLLVHGALGLPALGAEGSALATLAARLALAGGTLFYILRLMPERRSLGRGRWSDHGWRAGRRQRRLGYAEGMSMGIESGSFALLTVFAGQIGAVQLAAYTIAVNINMMLFMLAVGVGGAAAVRVAQARGRHDGGAMARSGATGLAVFSLLMLGVALLFLAVPGAVTALYTGDPALAAATAPIVALIGFVAWIDGAQRVIANILRGYGEAWAPTTSHLVSYVAVMVPAAWALSLPLGLGALGLILAIALASVVATGLLLARFRYLAARPLLIPREQEITWASS
ncbi:MATE family efflux transporter [Zavarzinia compransoris]|uniref:MATE family efflux transporter n=1 Tax=Zavarzinia compransoris TaxID=1264899 RepID=UPI0010E1BFB5|nr:MATE family efflux transporter [Zavarzinia compransoris]TDP44249.1 MATE family multidrug resistance protein [Zavarzinia compransoris]